MGVHGLTLYLRENKRILAQSLDYSSSTTPKASIVIDGWSFIYELFHRSSLPWVYGGEHPEFENLIVTVVQAWLSVGLKLYFVFDGATPELKFQTATSRLTQSHIQPSLLFFRTSAASRSTSRFLHESAIIPPLLYPTCIHALQTISENTNALEIHYAAEEGDPYAVELAGRVGAFVAGNDSDFVIFESGGYLGYVPLDEMLWTSMQNEIQNTEDLSGFQTVRNSKSKKKILNPSLGRGLIPPNVTSGLTLSFIVYKPSVLATHLKLPASLLPLLGALVGNDFSNQSASTQQNAQSMFFQRQLSLSQRIDHVAATLGAILSASMQKRKPRHQVGSVMDLIDKAVDALLVRSRTTMGSGEIENIISTVVEATLQYAIPKYEGEIHGPLSLWPTPICALHQPDVCPLLPMFSRSLASEELSEPEEIEEQVMRENIRALYVRAYRSGWLPPKILNILKSGTSWPRLFLENPDLESVARSVGRPIRQWIYAILQDSVDIPDRHEEIVAFGDEDDRVDEERDGDELIDVEEEDSEAGSLGDGVDGDPLAVLRGELERLRLPEDVGAPEPPKPSSTQASQNLRPKTVVEYVRRGTRVATEEVTAPFLADLIGSLSLPNFNSQNQIPLLLRSEDDRLTILLCALGSNTQLIRSLPSEQLMTALALRWVVRVFSDRAQSSGGIKDREKERWTKPEARAFLASFSWVTVPNDPLTLVEDIPPIVDRNIQLMAQALMALESIADLSQVLLLSSQVPHRGYALSGKKFHSFLTGMKTPVAADIPLGLWDACVQGLEDAFGEVWKKARKGSPVKTTRKAHPVSPRKGTTGGLFDLLGDMAA